MLLQFLYLNSPPVVAVNCDNQKAMGKEKWHKVNFEKSTKKIAQSLENKTKKTNKQTNKQRKRQNGNQILNQQTAKM